MSPTERAKVWWEQIGRDRYQQYEERRRKNYRSLPPRKKKKRRRRSDADVVIVNDGTAWRWDEYQRELEKAEAERRQRAAATGEPLVTVTGLPEEFVGQLTVTLGDCWRWHGDHYDPPKLGGWSWHWTEGYARYQSKKIYRLLYVALIGPVAKGNHLHHRCFRGWCSNPWHLEELTREEHSNVHAIQLAWLRAASMAI